jgi:hypothetical protein
MKRDYKMKFLMKPLAKKPMTTPLLTALAATLFVGCSPQKQAELYNHSKEISNSLKSVLGFFEGHQISIRSMDDQPIVGAQVLIGESLNTPLNGNFLTTNSLGQVMAPAEWTQALPITVQAPGFVRTTFIAQMPDDIKIVLHPTKSTPVQYEVKGLAQDLPVKNGDDQFDFGIVMPAFTKMDLLSFNLESIISPNSDRITALGQNINIPSNISLPKQSEYYSIVNITLDKPAFRTYFPQKGIQRMVSLRARFPFKNTVDSLRSGKSFIELINQFKIGGAGVRDINIQNQNHQLNIPTSELSFNDQKNITAPLVRGNETFLAVGMAHQSGFLIPTDIKTIPSGKSQSMALLPNSDQRFLGILKLTDDLRSGNDRMSATLLPFTMQTTPKLLQLVNSPNLIASHTGAHFEPHQALLPPISAVDGINPIGTYSVLSSAVEVQQGVAKVKIMAPQWEVYAPSWVAKFDFPQWPIESDNSNDAQSEQHFEVTFIGSTTTSQVNLGPDMIEAATHVTHSSISY